MDNHDIARVLDAGSTPQGLLYFAMKLGEGIPITAYWKHKSLTITERGSLFIEVCRAIQHAHQKHRGDRFGIVNSMTGGLERYLNQEPLEAAPPANAYLGVTTLNVKNRALLQPCGGGVKMG